MMRISTGVISAFVVLSAAPASAEKLTLLFRAAPPPPGGKQDVNQVIFDTERPRVDLRVPQTMGTDAPVDYTFENNAERKDSIQMVSEVPPPLTCRTDLLDGLQVALHCFLSQLVTQAAAAAT